MITSEANHFETNKTVDRRAVLTWTPAPPPRRAFALKLHYSKGFLTENVKPLLDLTVAPNNEWRLGYITAFIFSRFDVKQGESRFLVTCDWGSDCRWSHARSTKAAKRIAARWFDKFNTFNDYYRIKEA